MRQVQRRGAARVAVRRRSDDGRASTVASVAGVRDAPVGSSRLVPREDRRLRRPRDDSRSIRRPPAADVRLRAAGDGVALHGCDERGSQRLVWQANGAGRAYGSVPGQVRLFRVTSNSQRDSWWRSRGRCTGRRRRSCNRLDSSGSSPCLSTRHHRSGCNRLRMSRRSRGRCTDRRRRSSSRLGNSRWSPCRNRPRRRTACNRGGTSQRSRLRCTGHRRIACNHPGRPARSRLRYKGHRRNVYSRRGRCWQLRCRCRCRRRTSSNPRGRCWRSPRQSSAYRHNSSNPRDSC